LHSTAERSKDRNKATAVTTKLQCGNALICFTERILKRIENKALLCYAMQKCEQTFKGYKNGNHIEPSDSGCKK